MKFLISRKLGDIISNEDPFSFIDRNFISGAEIMLSKPQLMDQVDLDDIRKKCKGLKLTAHLPFYDLNLASVDSFIRDYSMQVMVKGLKFCEDMKIERAVAHLGFNVKLAGKAAAKWKEKFFVQKKELESKAFSNGVKVVWENTYEENFELFDEMLENDPDTLFCIDAGHCSCFADFSAVDFIERYRKNTVHLHLHDNNGREDSHLAPGAGKINFKEIKRVLDDSNIGNAVLEIEPEKYINNRDIIQKMFKAEEK